MTASSTAALKAYAKSGLGASVVPELTVAGDASSEDLVVVALEGADRIDTRMCLCRRRSHIMGNAAQRLLDDYSQFFTDAGKGHLH